MERDVGALVVARVGQVQAMQDATRPWVVVDGAGRWLEPVDVFLRDLLACGSSPSSCRSYAYDLLRWFRFLAAVGVSWERVTRVELRDFVLWLRTADNPARARRAAGAPAAGAVNSRTGKVGLRPGYAPATINHAVAVLSAFYDFHAQAGRGPVVSPVPPQTRAGGRVHAHHNPQAPFALHRRSAYRQRQPDVEPRAVPDAVIDDLFGQLRCHRDRALLSIFLTSGARAGEVLGLTVGDVQPGDGRVWVRSKGLGGHKQACPVSPETLGWLALYLAELAVDGHQPGPADPLWWTRRQPWRPLTYTALRAVLNRINARIGTTVTLHDLRHTLCLRLLGDPAMTLVDVQQVMRHQQITTTSRYLQPRIDEVIAKVQEHYLRPPSQPAPLTGWQYDPTDLADVLGGGGAPAQSGTPAPAAGASRPAT